MALRSTQALTEMRTSDLPGGKGWPARKAINVFVFYELIVCKIWEPRRTTTLRPSRRVTWIALLFFIF
jgi:hypothetical protein